MLEAEEIVGALQRVFRAWLSSAEPRITVYPVQDHFEAAVRHGRELVADVYDPAQAEWALIVDTNGDAYTHSDAYEPGHCLGNVFRQPVAAVLDSDARRRLLSARATRAETCERCRFGQACSRIPVIEALPSERRVDAAGRTECTVAQPLIAWMTELIAQIKPAAAGAAA